MFLHENTIIHRILDDENLNDFLMSTKNKLMLNKCEVHRIYLINLKGEFLFEIKNIEENVEIIGLSPGIYYLIIENESGIEKVKIVKE